MSKFAIRTQDLTRTFSGFIAVNSVNFEVPKGELRAIIGPNGAGKTTFFRLLTGELPASAGRVWFEGRDVTHSPAYHLARLGIGKSYQITNGFPNLTVFENVRIAVQPPGLDFKFWVSYRDVGVLSETTNKILDVVELGSKRNILAGELSYGDRRRLELAMALGNDPRLLLLDEPTAGYDSKGDQLGDRVNPPNGPGPHRHPRRAQDEAGHEYLRSNLGFSPRKDPCRGLTGRGSG